MNNDDHVIDKIAAIDLLKKKYTYQKLKKVHKWEEVNQIKEKKQLNRKQNIRNYDTI